MALIHYLLLPALACGRMAVFINITPESEPFADVTGHFTNAVSDVERATFKIENKDLMAAVANYSGQPPVTVSVNNTSRLYESYKWLEVKRTVRPGFKIDVSEADANCEIPEQFKNEAAPEIRVTGAWSGAKVTVSEKTENKISVFGQSLKFNSTWGQNINETKTQKFDPAPAKVKKCTVTTDIGYVAKLSGEIAVDFGKKYKNSYYWAIDIVKLQANVTLPRTVAIKQTITISYYQKIDE